MIKIYTTPICSYCFSLKNFLKENNIEFEEIDLSKDEEKQKEIIKRTGQTVVPIIEIDNELIVGFDKEKISKLLRINE